MRWILDTLPFPAATASTRIHGLFMSLDYWEGIWQNFSDFRNVRIDVPGHGDSEPRLEGLELEQFGAWVNWNARQR